MFGKIGKLFYDYHNNGSPQNKHSNEENPNDNFFWRGANVSKIGSKTEFTHNGKIKIHNEKMKITYLLNPADMQEIPEQQNLTAFVLSITNVEVFLFLLLVVVIEVQGGVRGVLIDEDVIGNVDWSWSICVLAPVCVRNEMVRKLEEYNINYRKVIEPLKS